MSGAKVSRHRERAEMSDGEREASPDRLRKKRKKAAGGGGSPEESGDRKGGQGKDDAERRRNKENDRRGAWGNSRERYGNTYYDRDYYDDGDGGAEHRGGHREYRGGRYWEKDRDDYQHRRDRDAYDDRARQRRERDAAWDGGAPRRRDGDDRNRRERDRDRPRREDGGTAAGEDGPRRQDRTLRKADAGEQDVAPAPPPPKNKDMLTSKTGGAYIPPAKLRMMQAQITDKSSVAYQRIAWEALKKSIHGHINKVNVGNLKTIVRDLLKENVVRGRGLLCRSIIQAQAASPTFTHVYAALVSVINSKFPNIGELLMKRIVLQFRRGFKRNDKSTCISAVTFIAHLVNQRVAHEIIALEILTLLVESPTDDSIEVAIAFLKECGMKLLELTNKGMLAIFEMLRNILHEGKLEKRVQYMIEVIFQIRKGNFQGHEAVIEDLDLVEEEDQFTHIITLDEVKDGEEILNVFKFDAEYEANEEKYNALKKEILDESSDESGSNSGSDAEEEGSNAESGDDEENKESTIVDNTETNLVALRRAIYLTIHSSLDFEECAHKLMRMQLKPGQEIELCHMFLDCCAEQRTYEKFFGLLAQRFCQINKVYVPPFQQIFRDTYNTIHRLDTNKLRNVAKFFAHLLFTDAISWEVLSFIRLNEEDTTSSSRIFIKILFQELSEYMSLGKLNDRVKDPTMQTAFEGLFPRDNPKNTRFAINFFTSIGLGGLTDELREHLKAQPKAPLLPSLIENLSSSDSDSSSSDDSSSSSSSDSSSGSSSDSDDSAAAQASKSDKRKRKSSSSSTSRRTAKKKTTSGGGADRKKKQKKKGSEEQQHKKKRKQKSSR